MDELETRITYEPPRIVEYIQRKGSVSLKDLKTDFGYDEDSAEWVLMHLERMKIATHEYVQEGEVFYPVWYLTEEGKDAKNLPEKVEAVLRSLPVFSKVIKNVTTYPIEAEAARFTNMDSLEELEKLIKKAVVGTVGELSPDEIRQFGREIERLRG